MKSPRLTPALTRRADGPCPVPTYHVPYLLRRQQALLWPLGLSQLLSFIHNTSALNCITDTDSILIYDCTD